MPRSPKPLNTVAWSCVGRSPDTIPVAAMETAGCRSDLFRGASDEDPAAASSGSTAAANERLSSIASPLTVVAVVVDGELDPTMDPNRDDRLQVPSSSSNTNRAVGHK